MGLGDWLDDAWNSTKGAAEGLAHFIPLAVPDLQLAGMAVDKIAVGTKDAFLGVIDGDQWIRKNAVSRPLSTAGLFQGNSPLDLDAWKQAWHNSENISPGQVFDWQASSHLNSLTSSLGIDLPGVLHTFANLPGAKYTPLSTIANAEAKNLQTVGSPGFNILDKAQRSAAFGDVGNFGTWASGSFDGILSWYGDPAVVAGKGIEAVKGAAVVKSLVGLTSADRTAKVVKATTALPALAPDASGVAKVVRAASTPFSAQARVTKLTDDLAAMNPAQRADYITRNPSMRSSPGLASLLARAPNADAMRMTLRYAMDPSPQNESQLSTIWSQAKNEVDNLRERRIPALEAQLSDLGNRLGPLSTIAPARQIAQAQTQLASADQARIVAQKMIGASGTLNVIPRVSARQAVAARTGWNVLQPTRYGIATRVIKSAATRRANTIDVNRPGDGAIQLQRFLGRVGHGTEVGGMPQQVQDSLMSRMADADGNPTMIQAVAQDAEHAAMLHLASALPQYAGESPEKIKQDVEAIMAATNTKRTNVTAALGLASNTSPVFGVAPGARDALGNFHLVDDLGPGWDDSGVLLHTDPLTSSQLANKVPLLDVDRLAKVLRRNSLAFTAEHREGTLAGLRAITEGDMAALRDGGSLARLSDFSQQALTAFNRFWKPAQLARLGWPIRVITDENLRMMSIFGAMQSIPMSMASVAHGAKYTKLGLKAADLREGLLRTQSKAERQLVDMAPLRAAHERATAERPNRVAQIEAANAHVATYDQMIPLLGKQLTDAHAALDGEALHQITNGGPGGTYTVGEAPTAVGEGLKVHRAMGLPGHDATVYRPTSNDANPGVATLRDMVAPKKFADLTALTVAELRATLPRFGVTGNLSGLRSREQLLAEYGRQLAERKGYRAIRHSGAAETYTPLSTDAIRAPGDDTREPIMQQLERAMTERAIATAHRDDLTGRLSADPPWSGAQQGQWEQIMHDALTPSERVAKNGKPLRFSGTVTMHLPNGQVVEVPDAFAGPLGKVFIDLSSAAGVSRSLAGLSDQNLRGYRITTGDPVSLLPISEHPKGGQLAQLHQASYDAAWEKAVNDELGKDAIGSRLLAGQSHDEILDHLKNTPDGRRTLDNMPGKATDPARWIEEVEQQIDTYLPTDPLRRAAADGTATAQMLKETFPNAADRPIVHGESLGLATGASPLAQEYDKIVGGLFRRLGTTPTNALTRHPFFALHYRQSMREQFAALDHLGPNDLVPPEQIAKMQQSARNHALTETKETLYDLANESNLGHAMRFAAPFYNAWEEALTVWGRLWMEDPSRLARLTKVWNAPTAAHMTYTDANGNEQVAIPLPKAMQSLLGASNTGIPKNTLRDLIFQGQYFYSPGFGPTVSVPVAEIVRNRPDLASSVGFFLPYGPGKDIEGDILPSWMTKLRKTIAGEDDPAYVEAWTQRTDQLLTDRQLGRNALTDPEIIAEAKAQAGHLTAFNFIASMLSPASIQVRPEYQMYYDQMRALQTQYRTYPNGRDPQGRNAQQAFLQANGEDFFYLTNAMTKSNIGGIAPTEQGYQASKKYADLIAANPQYGSLFAGGADAGAYSSAVEQYQLTHDIGGGNTNKQREVLSPQDAITGAQTSQGWDRYRQINTMIDSVLYDRGLRSITDADAADLKTAKDALVAQIETKYPAWKTAYGTYTSGKADALVGVMQGIFKANDQRFVNRPGWKTLSDYLAMRSQFENVLKERRAGGGSNNLQAQDNGDLKGAWDQYVGALRLSNTAFADLQTRYLENDKMEGGSATR